MKIYINVLFVVIVALFSGCDPSLPHKFIMEDTGDDGIVVMSITNNHAHLFGGANSFAPKIYIKSIERDFQIEVEGHCGKWIDKHLIKKGNSIGRVVAIKLPPGKYEIYKWTTSAVTSGGHLLASSKSKPNIYFEAEAHRILYAGNIDLYIYSITDTYQLVVNDERIRDIAEFRQKWPNLRDEKIEIKLAIRLQGEQ